MDQVNQNIRKKNRYLVFGICIFFVLLLILFICLPRRTLHTQQPREGFDARPEPKIVYFIISHQKNKHGYAKFKNKPDTFIVVGNLKQEAPYLLEDGILTVRANDLYFGLPEKIIMMHEAFLNMPELSSYTHLYKIDDDCDIYEPRKEFFDFVRNVDYAGSNISKFLRGSDNHMIQAGKIGTEYHFKYSHQDPDNYWAKNPYLGNYVNYVNGPNYILSRPLINKINKIWNHTNIDLLRTTEIFEDLMIGKVCFLLGYPPSLFSKKIIFVIDEIYRAHHKRAEKAAASMANKTAMQFTMN